MYGAVTFDASINDYFDCRDIYCVISLSNLILPTIKMPLDRQIPRSSNSRLVTQETRT